MNKRRRITIKDVAREAGVSITTVSRYINKNYGAMTEETRQRIKNVIDSLGFQPNKLAQGLKGPSRNIAVVVVNIGYPFCVSVIRSISKVLSEAGYNLMVCETGGDPKREETMIRSLIAQNIGGLIIQTNGENNPLIEEIAQTVPVVLIDREFNIPSVVNVVTNDQEASKQLTCALFREGYQKVLYITEPLGNISTRKERLQGYTLACEEYNREPWITEIERGNTTIQQSVVHQIIGSSATSPFAIYTANGLIMLDFYPLLKATHVAIPNFMGLATFDKPDWATLITPSLTCVHHPTDEMGNFAAREILQQIKDGRTYNHHIVVIDSTVIWSHSTQLQRQLKE
ncbi:MAG TPA: LacI family DNA-binding transcriptional regulator [Bacillota bacterium]|nr:LacI family DNA-binding transcriptional regulator [Bacillota bacterium]